MENFFVGEFLRSLSTFLFACCLLCAPALADETEAAAVGGPCENSLETAGEALYLSWGTEWEVASFPSSHEALLHSDDLAQFVARIPIMNEFFLKSRFKELYGLYGRDSSGHFRPNLLPNELTSTKKFQELRKKYPDHFVVGTDGVFFKGWEALDYRLYTGLIVPLFELRKKDSRALIVQKIPSAMGRQTLRVGRKDSVSFS